LPATTNPSPVEPANVSGRSTSAAAALEAGLVRIVRSSDVLMRALRAARTVDPPDWLIGAGAIRNVVWDRLHGHERPTPLADVDLVFFEPVTGGDAAGASWRTREREVLEAVAAIAPDIPWDVKNQAAVHLWYPDAFGIPVPPLRSSADAVGTWPETATAVAVRLLPDDGIRVVAPCGLEDLFGLVCRRNPRRVTVEEYRRRVQSKRIAERWPRVRVVDG
jgi:hypothetical protein